MPSSLRFIVSISCILFSACGEWDNENKLQNSDRQSAEHKDPVFSTANPRDASRQDETSVETVEAESEENERGENEDVNQQHTMRGVQQPTGFVLAESGADTDFTEWLTRTNSKELVDQLGVVVDNGKTLELKTDATLSFSAFAQQQDFLIRTQGHNLTLVGHRFDHLRVVTASADGHSGHVTVFASSDHLPSVDTSGSNGRGGQEGQCPETQQCVRLTSTMDAKTDDQDVVHWDEETTELQWNWTDSTVPEQWREEIKQNIVSETADSLKFLCQPGSHVIDFKGPQVSGTFKLRQRLRHPVDTQAESRAAPQDAVLYPAGPGSDGFDAGDVLVFQLGAKAGNWLEGISALQGTGGMGGVHLKTPASPMKPQQTFETKKESEEFLVHDLLVSWNIRCLSIASRFPDIDSKVHVGRFYRQQIPTDTQHNTGVKQLTFAPVQAGSDTFVGWKDRAPDGRNGKPGRTELFRFKHFDEWKNNLHSSIPIPTRSRL